ncbi:MAG: hypothetical protein RL403_2124 [Bacteroidota bacterium]
MLKRPKEYLLEFLMLFLAVSMGFIAENIREQINEKRRAHEMIVAFRKDVEQNQYLLDSLIERNTAQIHYMDSLSHTIGFNGQPLDLQKFSAELNLWMYRFMNRKNNFEQMKSVGTLRNIKDFDLLDQILTYEQMADLAEVRATQFESDHYWNQFRPQLREVFPSGFFVEALHNPKYMQALNGLNADYDKFYEAHAANRAVELKQVMSDPEKLDRISKMFHERVTFIKLSTLSYKTLHGKGEKLIQTLKEKGYGD